VTVSDRATLYLRITCLVLAGVLTIQILQLVRSTDPLSEADSLSMGTWTEPEVSAGSSTQSQASPKASALPAAVQSRVDHVVGSEVFGAIPKPLPMALLGIGGENAFIRTPSGQSKVMRAGEEAEGVKLLQIGTNRVLIEHEGKAQELILYPDLGGGTLLPGN